MNENLQVSTLPNGDVQVKMEEEMTASQLMDALGISREKEKKTEILANGVPVVNKGLPIEARTVILRQELPDTVQTSFERVDVVYEDDYSLVANKPAFLLVHDDGQTPDNLTSRVNGYLQANGWPFEAQAVNRIDREASGLVLFSKNPLFQAVLDRQMEDRTARKEYYAVLDGLLERRHIDINNPIGRNRHNADQMIVFPQGKPAHTHLERVARRGTKTLAKADISTGRKHQIRVHAAHIGHAIWNDALYGKKEDDRGLLLQAFRLTYSQPVTGEKIVVEVPMDRRFREFFQKPKKPGRNRKFPRR